MKRSFAAGLAIFSAVLICGCESGRSPETVASCKEMVELLQSRGVKIDHWANVEGKLPSVQIIQIDPFKNPGYYDSVYRATVVQHPDEAAAREKAGAWRGAISLGRFEIRCDVGHEKIVEKIAKALGVKK